MNQMTVTVFSCQGTEEYTFISQVGCDITYIFAASEVPNYMGQALI